MPKVDPFVSLRDWKNSLFRGSPEAIETFLEQIDATLPAHWTRDVDHEPTRLRA